ncbi:hypothetical protein IQ06DRAFT_342087 [Phaeosphaeriaceae sp. SRC1lsM3a]|nr:hypothetical protein IQ06DRAFT_342087 [Stagonospora sp. SRC1lsM3a]
MPERQKSSFSPLHHHLSTIVNSLISPTKPTTDTISALPAQPVLQETSAFAALNDQRRSPLLKLRNSIFAYTFQKHRILIRRLGRD